MTRRDFRRAGARGAILAAALTAAVLIGPAAAAAVQANMVVYPNPALEGQKVDFEGGLSNGLNFQIGCPSQLEFWDWDFNGDGVTDASGEHVSHVFNRGGDYRVTLTVGSVEWCRTDSETQTVQIRGTDSLGQPQVTAMPNFTFSPRTYEARVGETIRFRNGGGSHNVHFDDGWTNPPAPNVGLWNVARTFTAAGVYHFVCQQHSAQASGGLTNMEGTIVVQ